MRAWDGAPSRVPDSCLPDKDSIAFRLLSAEDLPVLHRWLNTPHVLEWWDNPGPSLEEVEQKYHPRILATEPTRCYVILYGESPIGFIQTYLIDDYPDYGRYIDVEEVAAGVDLFIGEPELVHRGLGAPILRRFLREVVLADPQVESCIIGPAVSNRTAIRAYEKAGFSYLKTVQIPDEAEPEYLMRVGRPDLAARRVT